MVTLINETTTKAINAALLSIKNEMEGIRAQMKGSEPSSASNTDGDYSALSAQVEALSASVTSLSSSVSSLSSSIAGKQAALNATQMNAVNSGITSSKVSTYDGYASQIAGKQDALVSGTSIKTINNTSLLGSGNITLEGVLTVLLTGTTSGTLAADSFSALTSMPFVTVPKILYLQFDLANNIVCTCFNFKFTHTGNPQLKGIQVCPNVEIPSGTSYSVVGLPVS